MSRIAPEVAAAVWERAGYGCEMRGCERQRSVHGFVFHHRQARGMGGSKGRNLDVAENILWLHSECHEHIHASPQWARFYGYIVSQYEPTPGGVE